jgi:hypothetical protein
VPVYGAWLWDRNLGIGLATEIDAADALSPYRTARNAIVIVLGITVLIALGSLTVAVLIDERANRALQKGSGHVKSDLQTGGRVLQPNPRRPRRRNYLRMIFRNRLRDLILRWVCGG